MGSTEGYDDVKRDLDFFCLGGNGRLQSDLWLLCFGELLILSVYPIQAGFDHIRQLGPTGTDQNQNVEWCELERNNPESPLYQWPAGLIKESLANLSKGKACAKAQKAYPLTLRDVKSQVLKDVVLPFISKHMVHGAIWAGQSGVGKTPLARILATAFSEYAVYKHSRDHPTSRQAIGRETTLTFAEALQALSSNLRCTTTVTSSTIHLLQSRSFWIPRNWRRASGPAGAVAALKCIKADSCAQTRSMRQRNPRENS